ncbi:MAG: flavodoxin [Fibrobacter sp.]|nr:flavodoxin [Fibrobacter sp.]
MKKIISFFLTIFMGAAMAAETKKLVIYYSRTDENYSVGYIQKGNTEIVAEIIAEKTGATLLKVEPVKEYPKEYDDCIAVAKKELANDARPDFKPISINPEEFDEIYVGYPVWWGEMPMTMFTFFEKYNLKGKTIHPFVTHEGSGLSGVARLKKVTGANVKPGLAIYGHTAQNEKDKAIKDVEKWLK